MNGKQIQHLYHLSVSGFAVYDRTEIIDIYDTDFKTDIVHLIILPDKKPEPLPTRTEVLDALIDAGTEQEEDDIVDKLPETFWGILPNWLFLQ